MTWRFAAGLGAICLSGPTILPGQVRDLSPGEAALILEARQLASGPGRALWPDWVADSVPILFRTGGFEYLMRHPSPPAGFTPRWSAALGETLYLRETTDSTAIMAAYPVGGSVTAAFSAPDSSDDPRLVALLLMHELFHGYQGTRRIADPFRGDYGGFNDLTFPFPYDDPVVRATLRLEAEALWQMLQTDSVASPNIRIQGRLLGATRRLLERIVPDPALLDYKAESEWKEGVARFTEWSVAAIARDSTRYHSANGFREQYRSGSYAETWNARYAGMLNPVRFVGEGVRGRVMFYYLGLAKAVLLERLEPNWRSAYLNRSLDDVLGAALVR